MKKRIGTFITAIVMACVMSVAVGCSNTSSKPDFIMPPEGFDTTKPVTITFYHTMGQKLRDVLDRYIEEFRKLYPNVTILHESQGKYPDLEKKISDEIVAGNQPNFAYCYPDHVALYNRSNSVLVLNDFLPGGAFANMTVTQADGNTVPIGLTAEEKEMFNPNYYEEGYKFGDESKMYSLPWIKSTEALYYNADYFTQNGLEVPQTWNDLEKLCETIKAKEPTKYAFTYDSEDNWFITMCEQFGSGYTSATSPKYIFDNQTNRDFVARFAEWYNKGWFTTETLNGSYTSDLFKEGASYMCIGSTGGASYQTDTSTETFPFKVGIARIPQVDPNNAKCISQGPSVCIFKNEDPQKVLASWLFIKYVITNVKFQAQFSQVSGYMPVLTSEIMNTNEIYKDFLSKADDPNYLTALAVKVGMENASSYFVSPAFVGSSEARKQVGPLMTTVFEHPDQLDQAFKYAMEQCEYMYG